MPILPGHCCCPAASHRGPDGKLSARSVSQILTTLKAALNYAVADKRLTWNPASTVKAPSAPRAPVPFWEPHQLTAFLARAQEVQPHLAIGYMIAGFRGLRRGEVTGLRWSDIDLDAGVLHVRRSVSEVSGQLHIGEPKTDAGARVVSLGPMLATALRAHRKAQAARRLAAPEWEEADLVLTDERGRMVKPHVLSLGIRVIASQVDGLPPLHFHGLRHTAASTMLRAGIQPKVVSHQLGHKQVSMTLDLYGHVAPAQRDESAEAAERLFRQGL